MALTEDQIQKLREEKKQATDEERQRIQIQSANLHNVARDVYVRLVENGIDIAYKDGEPSLDAFSEMCHHATTLASEAATIFGRNVLGYDCYRGNPPDVSGDPQPEFEDDPIPVDCGVQDENDS